MKIGFSTEYKSWISKIMIFFTKSSAIKKPYISHAFPILGDFNGMELALSSDEFLNNIIDVNRYRKPTYALRIYELDDRVDPVYWQPFLVGLYNQKIYPHLELPWFIWRWLVRFFKKDYKGKNIINYSVFCSELTVIALKMAGYAEEFKNIDQNSIDAIELELAVSKIAKLVEER